MAAMDFPANPTHGQVFGDYWWDSTAGSRTVRLLKNGSMINAEKITPFNGPH